MDNNPKKVSISLSIASECRISEIGSTIEIFEVHKLDEALTLTKFGKFNFCLIFTSGLILTTVSLKT